MLIAVMGNTYGNVRENSQSEALKEKITLLNDYRWVSNILKLDKSFQYVIIVKPSTNDYMSESWEG